MPTGYIKDETVYTYNFAYKDMNTPVIAKTGVVHNEAKKEPFEIIKISTDTNDTATLLENVEFTAILKRYVDYYGSFTEALKHTSEYAEDEWCVMKTDFKGHCISKRLAYGNYVVNETFNPYDGVNLVKEFEVSLTENSETPAQNWKIENDTPFRAYLKLVKKDTNSGKYVTLSGATFELYRLNEITNEWELVRCKVGKDYYNTWTTDNTAVAYTETKLPYGQYKLCEVKIPNGFLELQEEVTFKISASNKTCEYDKDGDAWITVEVKNEQPKAKLDIIKKVEEKDLTNNTTYVAEDIDYSKIKYRITAASDIIDYADGSCYYEKGEEIGIYSVGEDGTLSLELPMRII